MTSFEETGKFDGGALKGKRVLVVGATGFLGSWLTPRLASLGAGVIGVSRSAPSSKRSDAITWHHVDFTNPHSVEQIFEASQPDLVFHLTSDSHGGQDLDIVPSSLQNDVVATVNALFVAARARRKIERFVMTASLDEPLARGSEEVVPMSPYAMAKWATGGYGRMFKKLYGLDVRIVRPMLTYGPRQKDYKLIPSTILSLLRNQPARIGSGSRLVDWIYVEDTIEGMIRAALAPALNNTVDLGSGKLASISEVVHELARQLGKTHLLKFGEGPRRDEVVRVADVSGTRRWLGFEARVPLQEGLSRTIDWYREARPAAL